MNNAQLLIVLILAATTTLFLWGRWRHDMVAVAALFACVVAGVVPATDAFAGFGHPAVITVACILILSSGLKNSGAVDVLMRYAVPTASGPTLTIAALTALAALLSAFMNNVGALALLMPVALQIAAKQSLPPGKILMPLAFGSILGGMTTLIGTPPNLIVSGFRQQTGAGNFAMFDFAPVGVAVTLCGVLFIALIGWRLVPARKQSVAEGFDTGAYLTEAKVSEGSNAAGKRLFEVDRKLDETGAQVIGVVRNNVRVNAPSRGWMVRAGDILIIEAEANALPTALSALGLRLEEDKQPPPAEEEADKTLPAAKPAPEGESKPESQAAAEDVILMELAVLPGSSLTEHSASDLRLRTNYGINLLAVSRQGRRSLARLRSMRLAAGDVLLMQGSPEALSEFAASAGCVPLAARELRIPDKRRALTAFGIMAAAVTAAALGVPAALAFMAGVLASLALRTVPPRSAYDAVDWPVIVLLATLIPVAGAMESTGAADVMARFMLEHIAGGHVIAGLVLVLVVTMTLSDLMNNAATAAVMCPIAISTANQLGVNSDPFLMAVAIGASCAFLTPIGHQNNTLILGPGGFHFGDYWRMGLPLELLVIAVSVPLLLTFWPF